MKYYWSKWFTRDELKSMGATDIIPAQYTLYMLVPHHVTKSSGHDVENEWAFAADETFITYMKLKSDKGAVDITRRCYHTLRRNESYPYGADSKLATSISNCIWNF